MKKWLRRLLVVSAIAIPILIWILCERDLPPDIVDARYSSTTSQFLTTENGTRIHYRDEGQSDAPPVVLIHGSNASLHTWEPWEQILGQHYRIISLDLPGHGLTGRVPDRDYSDGAMVRTVAAVTDHLDVNRFVLGGSSMGGGVTWKYTLAHPDQIQAMILVDAVGVPQWSSVDDDSSEQSENKGPLVFRLLRQPWFRAIARYLDPGLLVRQGLESAYTDQSCVTDELVQRYNDLALREGSREAVMDRFASMDRRSREPVDLSTLGQPTLILWGRDDALVAADIGDRFESALPDSTLIVYDNVGHLPMEEIPERSAGDVLKFLQQLKLTSADNTPTTDAPNERNLTDAARPAGD